MINNVSLATVNYKMGRPLAEEAFFISFFKEKCRIRELIITFQHQQLTKSLTIYIHEIAGSREKKKK
jgi:hypothetical protein